MEKTIFAQIRNEVKSYEDTTLDQNPSYASTMPRLLRLIDLYENSKFLEGDADESGLKRFFYNIINFRVALEVAHTDIDSKDIKFIAEIGQSHYPVWLLQKEFAYWVKDKGLSQLWNEMCEAKTKYGSVVVKKVGNELVVVPLRNLIIADPRIRKLTETVAIEKHLYSFDDLKDCIKLGWDATKIAQLISLYAKHEEKFIPVYERYGLWIDESKAVVKTRHIVAGIEFYKEISGRVAKTDTPTGSAVPGGTPRGAKAEEGIIIDEDTYSELPYKEFHRIKLHNRWLGRGKPEELFEPQIRENDMTSILSKALYWSSLRLFQSADELLGKNLLSMARNGDIINSQSGIKRIEMEERNLAPFNFEFQRWDRNSDDISHTHAPIMGETKAGTPLGLGRLQAQLSGSFYEYQKEKFGLFIKELLWDDIIPKFKTIKNKQHLFNFINEDENEFEQFITLIVNARLNDWLGKFKRLPPLSEVERQRALLSAKLREGGSIEIGVPDSYYKNIKFRMDIIVVGESVDLGSRNNVLITALQMLGTNPAILQDPTLKKIFFKLIEGAGLSPIELEGSKMIGAPMAGAMPLEQGGSLPKLPAPVPGVGKSTLKV